MKMRVFVRHGDGDSGETEGSSVGSSVSVSVGVGSSVSVGVGVGSTVGAGVGAVTNASTSAYALFRVFVCSAILRIFVFFSCGVEFRHQTV